MPILRSSYQLNESIEEFYRRDIWKGPFAMISQQMLDFINLINKHFVTTTLIASTSHQRLCIQDKDDEKLNWLIIISNSALGEYYFEYKVPQDKSPWDDAWMKGTAKNLKEALIFLLIAMRESEVWNANEELGQLLKEYVS